MVSNEFVGIKKSKSNRDFLHNFGKSHYFNVIPKIKTTQKELQGLWRELINLMNLAGRRTTLSNRVNRNIARVQKAIKLIKLVDKDIGSTFNKKLTMAIQDW